MYNQNSRGRYDDFDEDQHEYEEFSPQHDPHQLNMNRFPRFTHSTPLINTPSNTHRPQLSSNQRFHTNFGTPFNGNRNRLPSPQQFYASPPHTLIHTQNARPFRKIRSLSYFEAPPRIHSPQDAVQEEYIPAPPPSEANKPQLIRTNSEPNRKPRNVHFPSTSRMISNNMTPSKNQSFPNHSTRNVPPYSRIPSGSRVVYIEKITKLHTQQIPNRIVPRRDDRIICGEQESVRRPPQILAGTSRHVSDQGNTIQPTFTRSTTHDDNYDDHHNGSEIRSESSHTPSRVFVSAGQGNQRGPPNVSQSKRLHSDNDDKYFDNEHDLDMENYNGSEIIEQPSHESALQASSSNNDTLWSRRRDIPSTSSARVDNKRKQKEKSTGQGNQQAPPSHVSQFKRLHSENEDKYFDNEGDLDMGNYNGSEIIEQPSHESALQGTIFYDEKESHNERGKIHSRSPKQSESIGQTSREKVFPGPKYPSFKKHNDVKKYKNLRITEPAHTELNYNQRLQNNNSVCSKSNTKQELAVHLVRSAGEELNAFDDDFGIRDYGDHNDENDNDDDDYDDDFDGGGCVTGNVNKYNGKDKKCNQKNTVVSEKITSPEEVQETFTDNNREITTSTFRGSRGRGRGKFRVKVAGMMKHKKPGITRLPFPSDRNVKEKVDHDSGSVAPTSFIEEITGANNIPVEVNIQIGENDKSAAVSTAADVNSSDGAQPGCSEVTTPLNKAWNLSKKVPEPNQEEDETIYDFESKQVKRPRKNKMTDQRRKKDEQKKTDCSTRSHQILYWKKREEFFKKRRKVFHNKCGKEFNIEFHAFRKYKNYNCEICKKRRAYNKSCENLLEKSKKHKFLCKICYECSFKTSGKLLCHTLEHIYPSSIKCEECCSYFLSESTLENHRDKHDNKEEECVLCKSKVSPKKMLIHIKKEHLDKYEQCSKCGHKYDRRQIKNHEKHCGSTLKKRKS